MPKNKSIEEQYQKKTQLEHILLRPDTYIGSISSNNEKLWIYNEKNNKIEKKNILYIPALYKIFDEIMVNARDSAIEDKSTNEIRVKVTKDFISIWNNGKGIPIEIHKKEKCTVPELIFGQFLTGSNYDDTEERITGGRNGLGAKLVNVFSSEFIVEIGDSKNKKYFKQTYKRNMSWRKTPEINEYTEKKGFVHISFKPDFERFKITELSDDMINLFKKRVFDISATINKKIDVYLNDILIEVKDMKSYINMYYESDEIIYEKVNDRWQLGILYIPDNTFDQISFVNSIATFNGGTHVKHIVDNIVKKLDEIASKKYKDMKLKPSMVKENLVIFINSTIVNPQFSSQTKEELKTKVSEFGSKCDISDKIIKKLVSFGILEYISNLIQAKNDSLIKKKTDGKKESNIKGIPKLEDANLAGGKESESCYLILTEGDSAKALAMSGRSVIGNDRLGVFPLKGKLLNVREATAKQLLENEEIKNIKKIMGLKQGKKYTDKYDLRYGGIIILTDQDTDGFHIKGLLLNFIHYFWPSLLELNNFVYSLATPIIKVTKGRKSKCFYNMNDYEKWRKKNNNSWHIKYYKGLGTSNAKEAKEYFTDLFNKLIHYKVDELIITENQEESNDENNAEPDCDSYKAIKLAFEKKQSHNRKTWLLNNTKNQILDNNIKDVYIHDFVNKELKLFSYDDIGRSIPSIVDGLKPSTRKILFACLLRKLYTKKTEIKVSQLAGYVSDKTCYHHGEKSLTDAIVGMAQNYVGSNNINYLHPSGQFGTRLMGGKDHASPRYTFTFLEELTRFIFREEDDDILNNLIEDGCSIQPDFFEPILPTILVNGSEGIGTGFSTFIPSYNPEEIADNLFNLMDGKEMNKMKPWFRNFSGKVYQNNNNINIVGQYDVIDNNTIQINELPISMWTTQYKEFLENIEIRKDQKSNKNIISKFTDNNTESIVNFTVKFPYKKLELFIKNDTIESKLKLIKTMKISNMHLYNADGNIKKYASPEEILKEWYEHRLGIYVKRKNYLIGKLSKLLDILKYKVMFIEYVLDGKIIIYKQKKVDIISKLEYYEFPQLATRDEEKSFDYITSIPLFSLTLEKIDELNEKFLNKEEELNNVKAISEIDMWKSELSEFLERYLHWKKKYNIKKEKKSRKYSR
tara:strand:- start:65 stop:3499 length:3435 start_codon:yes stop_codon:yes gene_type:complete